MALVVVVKLFLLASAAATTFGTPTSTNITTTAASLPTTASATAAVAASTPASSVSSGLTLGVQIGIGAAAFLLIVGLFGFFLAARRDVAPSLSTTEEAVLELKAWNKATPFTNDWMNELGSSPASRRGGPPDINPDARIATSLRGTRQQNAIRNQLAEL